MVLSSALYTMPRRSAPLVEVSRPQGDSDLTTAVTHLWSLFHPAPVTQSRPLKPLDPSIPPDPPPLTSSMISDQSTVLCRHRPEPSSIHVFFVSPLWLSLSLHL